MKNTPKHSKPATSLSDKLKEVKRRQKEHDQDVRKYLGDA